MAVPGYRRLLESGELEERARSLHEVLSSCALCPRMCGVDRNAGELGACRTGAEAVVAAVNVHPWEEPPIAGIGGSGTIFFSGCTMSCVFCQNYPISQMGVGRKMSSVELAEGMLRLQRGGVHNINLVTPTHQLPAFVKALHLAAARGLEIPVVYNSSGYERVETLRLLEGIVDVYLPDIKYDSEEAARFCSGRSDYVEFNRAALIEMHRQVGELETDARGIARGGLMIRHLVLPEGLSGTRECLAFVRERLGPGTWLSLMNQYFPAHRALGMPPLDRKVSEEEYETALALLDEFGLENGFVQECESDQSPL